MDKDHIDHNMYLPDNVMSMWNGFRAYQKLKKNHDQKCKALYRNILALPVVDILKEAMGNCPAAEFDITPGILLKEVAYSAVGVTHYELSNYLSFKAWFEGVLFPELHNTHSNGQIIHRRVALIFVQWVSKIKGEIKKLVYCC